MSPLPEMIIVPLLSIVHVRLSPSAPQSPLATVSALHIKTLNMMIIIVTVNVNNMFLFFIRISIRASGKVLYKLYHTT